MGSGKHRKGSRPGRSYYVLVTSCSTLAVAAAVAAVYPAPYPVPRAERTPANSQDDVVPALAQTWSPVDESAPTGGPLEVPQIGVVLEGYDERYAALDAARAAEAAAAAAGPAGDVPPPRPGSPVETRPPAPAPTVAPPAEQPPVIQAPAAPSLTAPPLTDPAASSMPTPQPTSPPAPPSVPTPQPALPPAPPPVPTPSPVPTPPTGEPPPPTPGDTTLTLGQRYEHQGADGNVDFTITLVSVRTDLVCTAPGGLPAENGRLIGLRVEVLDPTPPAEGDPPSVSAADFRFLDADGVLTADVDTTSSAACLPDDWPPGQAEPDAPVEGRLVLDVPDVPGAIAYRPEAWTSGLRWDVPPTG